ncbi:hypothetical protein Sru01_16470 [Sphaerisporangium rufum]|uniref:Transposase IS701-like DDE domain-containing protein n=1 Tax=Sphaerisporangium rufum TaxID=1381558 RepID=A0A919V3W0_9ACTN|nr:hypothetical protein Sru01_16470 [Sphaerisporangium rufum]
MVAVPSTVVEIDPSVWADGLEELFAQVVASCFGRREPRLRARGYLGGLLSSLERKNGWSLEEFAGDATPDGMQRLLNHARWDADEARDAFWAQVAERIGSLAGVLVVDDTGFERQGRVRRGCSGSTPAPPGRSPTVGSGCSARM